ncbi:MAG TPA: glycoside hydrolase family 15 protein [Methylocystis sp.]|nr:glycoside hydrolase family 15 protein [Methylocystis sp.]
MATRIEDYGLIGNCETAALVSKAGSIDWFCPPRFDSAACFAALLGTSENGRFQIAPKDPGARVTRKYRDSTLILETAFETKDGAATLIDFMPRSGGCDLVRLVVGERGRLDFHAELIIRFDYGVSVPWVMQLEEEPGVRAVAGPDALVLRTPAPLEGQDWRTISDFSVGAGETVPFVLSYGCSYGPSPAPLRPQQALEETDQFWRNWLHPCPSIGAWGPEVKRSLLTLKALNYEPTGGVVAAPTTSLPEFVGGPRNWDYRYCWLRDAAFTLGALMSLGYYDEAKAWREWLLRAVAGAPAQMQILYGVTGAKQLPERELAWLSGYEESRPVRVGNAAMDQRQLDVYGEVLHAVHEAMLGGMPPTQHGWAVGRVILEHLEAIWREPDEGIWEVRGGPRQFTHSKVMAWVAFDRAADMATRNGGLDIAKRWRQIADEIRAEVCARGFDEELGSFVQFYGSRRLDASLLQIPLVGFLPPDHPHVRGTLAAIERRLVHESGLVLRYETESGVDGLPAGEGAFLACSFWLADNYVQQGRFGDARALFENLLAMRNDLGLLSEEYDPRARRMLGNFPQAFSHIGLINTAVRFARAGRAENLA